MADGLEQWFTEPVADGFVLAATHVPGTYMDFVKHVVPELQRRGLYHKDYTGATLRENLGLPIPRATMEERAMKLGLSIGYSRAHLDIPVKLVQRAEELGYDSVWTAEAYGTDAVTPLAYLAALTKRIKLGTGIMQLAARTPANAAMCAAHRRCAWPAAAASSPASACRDRRSSRAGTASRGVGRIIATRTTSRSCARSSAARRR